MVTTLTGQCHCGAVGWRIDALGDDTTICNCSICRRYGAIWAYGWLGETIHIEASAEARRSYAFGQMETDFNTCTTCGCVTDWTARGPRTEGPDAGRTRCAVNLRLAEPDAIADIPLLLFDGAVSFEDLPPDGRCIRDIVV